MINLKNFDPLETAPVVTLIGASINTAFASTINGNNDLRILNTGNAVVFAKWGKGAQTAAATDTPVGPGEDIVFNMGQADNVALFGASGNVYLQQGQGS